MLLSIVVTSILSILLQYCLIHSIYILYLSHAIGILGKWGSKFGKKWTRFSTLRAPAPTDLRFSIAFSHWSVYYPDPKKTVDVFLLFSNIFWIICFWLFLLKMLFQNLSKYCRKSWITHYQKNGGHAFVQQPVGTLCAKFKIDHLKSLSV